MAENFLKEQLPHAGEYWVRRQAELAIRMLQSRTADEVYDDKPLTDHEQILVMLGEMLLDAAHLHQRTLGKQK